MSKKTTNENLVNSSNQTRTEKILFKNQKYRVNCILTFNHKEQELFDVYLSERGLVNKDIFLKGIVSSGDYTELDISQLIKISTCIYDCERLKKENPLLSEIFLEWYLVNNGKFYIQCGDFQSIYTMFGITYSQEGGEFEVNQRGVILYQPSQMVLNY